MFFAREASLRERPNSLTASTVMPGQVDGVQGVLGEACRPSRGLSV